MSEPSAPAVTPGDDAFDVEPAFALLFSVRLRGEFNGFAALPAG